MKLSDIENSESFKSYSPEDQDLIRNQFRIENEGAEMWDKVISSPSFSEYSPEDQQAVALQFDKDYGVAQGKQYLQKRNTEGYGDFQRGLIRGTNQLQALGGGAISLVGDAVNSPTLQNKGFDIYQKNMGEAELYPATIQKVEDIEGFGDAVDWLQGLAGEQVPNLLSMAVGGGIGGAAGKQIVKKAALEAVELKVKEGVVRDVAEKAVADGIRRLAAIKGTQAGIAGSTAAMEGGGMYGDDAAKHGLDNANALSAGALGAVSGASEAFLSPVAGIMTRLAGVKTIGKEPAKYFLARLGIELPKNMAKEGGQEVFQEFLQVINEKIADPRINMADREALSRYLNVGAAGAVMGAGPGVINAAFPQQSIPAIDQETEQAGREVASQPVQTSQVAPPQPVQPVNNAIPDESERAAARQFPARNEVVNLIQWATNENQQASTPVTGGAGVEAVQPRAEETGGLRPNYLELEAGGREGINGPLDVGEELPGNKFSAEAYPAGESVLDGRSGSDKRKPVGKDQPSSVSSEQPIPATTSIIDIKAVHGTKVGNAVQQARANKESISLPEAYRRAGVEYKGEKNGNNIEVSVKVPKTATSPSDVKPYEDTQKALSASDNPSASRMPIQDVSPSTEGMFDSKAWNKERDDRIAKSRAAGNIHLDKVTPSVESMRGVKIYNVHDPKEKGIIRTVSNRGDVVVFWDDEYSAQKNSANEKTEKRGRKVVNFFESWLMPSDLKDYVYDKPKFKNTATPQAEKEASQVVPQQPGEPRSVPIRYNPSTDKYDGDLQNGDTVTDGKDTFQVSRRSGFTVELDRITPDGPKVYGSRSVDPTSPEFNGDLYKVASPQPQVSNNAEEKRTEAPLLNQSAPSASSGATTPSIPERAPRGPISQPWKMTLAEYQQDALDRNEYKDQYLADKELLDEFNADMRLEWRNKLEKAAEQNRIPDNVLDDFAEQFGEGSLSRTFRGVAAKGSEGYIFKDIREKPAEIRQIDKTVNDLAPHERTWKQQATIERQGMARKLNRDEWKKAKNDHKAAIQKAIYDGLKVPDAVLADYPTLIIPKKGNANDNPTPPLPAATRANQAGQENEADSEKTDGGNIQGDAGSGAVDRGVAGGDEVKTPKPPKTTTATTQKDTEKSGGEKSGRKESAQNEGKEEPKFSTTPLPPTQQATLQELTYPQRIAVRRLQRAGKLEVVSAERARQILENAGMSNDEAVKFMVAWHGSPHDHDGFRSDKIGTGEGNQAFGFGLYFATEKDVAESYRRGSTVFSGGKPLRDVFTKAGIPANILLKIDRLAQANNSVAEIAKAIDTVTSRSVYGGEVTDKAIEILKSATINKGRLYQVDLAPTSEEYLDWDKPLSDQSEVVRKALEKAGIRTEEFIADTKVDLDTMDTIPMKTGRNVESTGKGVYEQLSERLGKDREMTGGWTARINDDKAASEYLHSLGIRGIKYLDGSSRGKGEGSQNFVVFSDADIKITAKYSKDGQQVEGFVLPTQPDKTYLVLENIQKGQLFSKVVHETGIHVGRALQNHKGFTRILRLIEQQENAQTPTGGAIRKAKRMVPKDTPAENVSEEVLAYLVANQPKTSIVQKLIALIKNVLVKMGVNPDIFTAADLRALAEVAVYREAVKVADGVPADAGRRIFVKGMLVGLAYGAIGGNVIDSFARENTSIGEGEKLWRESYNTKLSDTEEKEYQNWISEGKDLFGVDLSGDETTYDLRGFWKNGGKDDDLFRQRKGHAPDTYKKPNHPTFSDESKYHGSRAPWGRAYGGKWVSETQFKPSPSMLNNTHDLSWYVDYMKQYGEGVELILPANAPRLSVRGADTAALQDPPRSFGLVREYMNRPEVKERFENIASYLWDADQAITRVQKEIGPQPETRDYDLLRRLTGKKVSDEIMLFDRDTLKPFLKAMAAAKVKFDDLGELAWAEHAPERNLQMRRVNARRYIDNVLMNMTDLEKEQYQEQLGRIQDDFVMNDRTRNERRDKFIDLMNDLSREVQNTSDSLTEELDDRQTELDARTDIEDETRDRLQKKIDNARRRLDRRLETTEKWESVKDRLSGMTDEQAAEKVARWQADAKYPQMRELVDRMRAINESALDMNYAAGELTEDEYNAIKGTYKFHVPLYREDMDESKAPTGRRGIGPLASPIKIASGSTKAVVDIFPHVVDRYQSAIQRKHKLEAGKVLYEMVTENPDEDRWLIGELEKAPYHDNEGNIRFYPDQVLTDNEIYVKVDGVKHIITVPKDNKPMMRWMEALKREPVELGPVLKASQKVTRILANLNTSASPEFLLTNFFRDIQTAGIHLETTEAKGMQRKILKTVKAAIKGIYREERGKDSGEWGEVYRDFAKHGGKISWMQGYENVEELAKNLESELAYAEGKKPKREKFRKVLDFVSAMNTSVENGVRLATYKALVDSGVSPRKAAYTAANLTVDFTRHGTAGPLMNSLYMFANAGIQGNVRMIKALGTNRTVQKIAGGIVGFGFAANIIGAFMGGDDDDGESYYDKLKRTNPSIFERNMVLMIPGTEGKYIKIPMPYGYNVFFVAGNEMASAVRGGTGYKVVDGMGRLVSSVANTFNPLGSATLLQTITPTVFDPVAQVMENKSWNGQALMPETNPFGIDRPDSERYFKSVNPIAKLFTEKINAITGGTNNRPGMIDVSPETIEMMVETFTGSLGKLAKDAVSLPILAVTGNLEMHKIPFARKVIGQKSDYVDTGIYRENRDAIKVFAKDLEQAEPSEKAEMRRDKRYRLIQVVKETEKRVRSIKKSGANEEATNRRLRTVYLEFNKKYNDTLQ